MRHDEGYELAVSKPEIASAVTMGSCLNQLKVVVSVPDEYSGSVISKAQYA